MTPKTLTIIRLQAKAGAEGQLRDALIGAGEIIRATEPLTLQWYGVELGEGRFAIIDTFAGQEGRDAHFAGEVAALLHDNADTLVEGGWDAVVGAIENAEILSSNLT